MNKKLSGAQAVIVPITKVGKNYIPYVENLRNRYIKYIDASLSTYLPGTTTHGVDYFNGMFITIADQIGNSNLILDLPLNRLNYQETFGQRQQIANTISLSNSYINVVDSSHVGKAVLLVFWYDLPEYSQRNISDEVRVDGLTIPIKTATFNNPLPDSLTMAGKRFRQVLFENVGVTPDYQKGITWQSAKNLYLTLRKGSYNVLENVPLTLLWQMKQTDKILFANIIFDFQSSYITVGGAGSWTNPVGYSVYLNFAYEK